MKNDYFNKYLNIAPFALALWRAPEAYYIMKTYSDFQRKNNTKKTICSWTYFKSPYIITPAIASRQSAKL